MSATSSASPTVTTAATTGTYGGLVGLVLALVAGITHTGFNLTDLAGVFASAGISGSSVIALALHHNAALRHDATLAVAAVPDLTQLKADVEDAKPVVADAKDLLAEVAPGVVPQLTADVAKVKSDLGGLAVRVDTAIGVTPAQIRSALVSLVGDVKTDSKTVTVTVPDTTA